MLVFSVDYARVKSEQAKLMNTISWRILLSAAAALAFSASAFASAGPLLSPWPEQPLWGWSSPVQAPPGAPVKSALLSADWDGWGLDRAAEPALTPWVVPMTVPGTYAVSPERGAFRFLYRPSLMPVVPGCPRLS